MSDPQKQHVQRAEDLQDAAADAFERGKKDGEREGMKDKERLDYLSAHPLQTEIQGGSDDGHTGTFWGVGTHSGTLRETIDVLMAAQADKGKVEE